MRWKSHPKESDRHGPDNSVTGRTRRHLGGRARLCLFQQIEVEKKTTSRFKRVQAAETDHTNIKAARDRVQELSKRRKSMQDSLRDMEKKQNEKAKSKECQPAR